ncbi:MAG: PQQ-binding-like beta-propeller repeat protein [Stackebrandtia sp.]
MSEDAVYGQDSKHRPRVIDVSSGKKVWTAKGEGEPLIYGDGVAIYRSVSSKGDGKVHAVDVKSGKELWSSSDVTPNSQSTIANGQLISDEDDTTLVTDLRTGKPQWRLDDARLVGQDDKHYLFAKTDGDKTSFLVTNHDGKKGD